MAHAQENVEEHIPDEEMRRIKRALVNETVDSAVRKIQEHIEELERTELNIAVTGEAGTGKSTFINAIRGLRNNTFDSAPTGVVETTKEPRAYPYPKFPKLKLWDLPGIGTENFKADQYLKLVEFDRYDFFIIISERFTSNGAKLAREIQTMGKRFYFIRSKIDQSLCGEKMANETTYNEKDTLDLIRKDCITGLQKLSMKSPKVFLISSFNLKEYDFPQLQQTIEKELPEHKKCIFLLALPNITQDVIQKKKSILQANIWMIALLSGVVAAIPIPLLDFGVNTFILMKEIDKYFKAFGLDEASLRNLAEHIGVPVGELRKATKTGMDHITKDIVIKLLRTAVGGLKTSGSTQRHFSGLLVGGISFYTIYSMLNERLNGLAEDAHLVLMRAFPSEG